MKAAITLKAADYRTEDELRALRELSRSAFSVMVLDIHSPAPTGGTIDLLGPLW